MSPSTCLSTPSLLSARPGYTLPGSSRELKTRANQQSKPEREDRINNRGINE
jgi:hypothetical protein